MITRGLCGLYSVESPLANEPPFGLQTSVLYTNPKNKESFSALWVKDFSWFFFLEKTFGLACFTRPVLLAVLIYFEVSLVIGRRSHVLFVPVDRNVCHDQNVPFQLTGRVCCSKDKLVSTTIFLARGPSFVLSWEQTWANLIY